MGGSELFFLAELSRALFVCGRWVLSLDQAADIYCYGTGMCRAQRQAPRPFGLGQVTKAVEEWACRGGMRW